ncbi:MAG TPA: YdeI/OmpD-associated family protein [Opitutaceae bacterium]|nr:YdeI/OmpD-associated family protein [Opitutaceae bacterium]
MTLPAELITALAADARASALFEKFPPSHRREYAKWVGEARQAATRQRRARAAVKRMKEKAAALH